MSGDVHKDIGPRQRFDTLEAVIEQVRLVHPKAWAEGSAGFELSFWVRLPDGSPDLVAHAWAVRGAREAMWVRMSPPTPDHDNSLGPSR